MYHGSSSSSHITTIPSYPRRSYFTLYRKLLIGLVVCLVTKVILMEIRVHELLSSSPPKQDNVGNGPVVSML